MTMTAPSRPAMPPSDHTPRPYAGPSRQEVLALRKQYCRATFTMALASDPGNLDPQMAAGSALFTLSQLAYDSLLSVNAE